MTVTSIGAYYSTMMMMMMVVVVNKCIEFTVLFYFFIFCFTPHPLGAYKQCPIEEDVSMDIRVQSQLVGHSYVQRVQGPFPKTT